MNEVLELRYILEQGQIVKHIMTGVVTLMIVEAAICIQAIVRYYFR